MFAAIKSVVLKIPRGKVATYGQVARAAGYPGRARFVAYALRSANGLPWHRVVGAGGRILLPGEAGFDQQMRLRSEGVNFVGTRIVMADHEFKFSATKNAKKKTLPKPKSK
jgi:methylated-DNA-protein-cysteine methyltransferase-like protein